MIDGQPASGAASGPAKSASERFVEAGLEQLGLEADATMMAVIGAVDSLYRPLIDALMKADLSDVPPEPGLDLSAPPREVERR
jgi:hypothetical protein